MRGHYRRDQRRIRQDAVEERIGGDAEDVDKRDAVGRGKGREYGGYRNWRRL